MASKAKHPKENMFDFTFVSPQVYNIHFNQESIGVSHPDEPRGIIARRKIIVQTINNITEIEMKVN